MAGLMIYTIYYLLCLEIERISFKETFEEWGEFLHIPSRSYTDFEEIRKEIVRDTDSKTGHSKGNSCYEYCILVRRI